ncbi:alpha/beta hydrolase [Mesorhizobium sp. NPDC059054]|uniref:alpha/beta hydrolase n=1 Tax=Mesorhizobium sp. NPDC059054 TaxID=3346711 RepID=UPI0036A60E30
MALTAAALADLHFGLRFAAGRYKAYANMDNSAGNAELFLSMSHERQGDAADLDQTAHQSGLALRDPTISNETAGPLLGMGEGDPHAAAAAAYRVQRAENILWRMATQLTSLSQDSHLRDALNRVREHIDRRRKAVRAARQRARTLQLDGYHYDRAMSRQPIEGQQIDVWFGTNRRHHQKGQFLGERASNVTYGRCSVFVPRDRPMGSLGRGVFGRIFKGDNRVKLQAVDIFDERQFWSSLANEVSALNSSDQHGFIFLHGYNTKFEDAARRTAQLKVDLAHKGPAGFFSWPSLGAPAGYAGDEAAIEGSELEIRRFLVDFASRSGASTIHIIAHSMGNRGLLRAMDAIANAAASVLPVRFGQIILAAPDVDAQVFQNLAAAYRQLSTRATLYVTNNDRAIGISRRLHNFARVGLTPPVAVVPGIDTIDASHVNLGLLGHAYAAEVRPVLSDIYHLIQRDTAPDCRFGLRKALGGKADHWEFIP